MQTYLLQALTTLLGHANILTTGTNHIVGTCKHTYNDRKVGMSSIYRKQDILFLQVQISYIRPHRRIWTMQQICFQTFKKQHFGNLLLNVPSWIPSSWKTDNPPWDFSNLREGGGWKLGEGGLHFMVFSFRTGISGKELNFNDD